MIRLLAGLTAAGEPNRLSVELDASGATLRDAVAIEGCTPVAGGVHCAGARAVLAHLGDGDDTFSGGPGPAQRKGTPELAIQVFGEDGDDRLPGGDASELLDGGVGADTVDGGGTGDLVRGKDGDDVVSGGEGDDLLADGSGLDRLDPGEGGVLAFEDATPESLPCGGGRDLVYPGVNDLPALDCERDRLPPACA